MPKLDQCLRVFTLRLSERLRPVPGVNQACSPFKRPATRREAQGNPGAVDDAEKVVDAGQGSQA